MGGNVENFQLPNGKYAWSITSKSYMQGSIDIVQRLFVEDFRTLNNGKRPHKGPLPHVYKPELDTPDEFDTDRISRYQQLIVSLRWAVELGRIDIQLEVALMSQYLMNPRERHLEALYLIFHFMWTNPNKRRGIDTSYPMIY